MNNSQNSKDEVVTQEVNLDACDWQLKLVDMISYRGR